MHISALLPRNVAFSWNFLGFILFCSYFHKTGLGEADDGDAAIKALKRDMRLEALFVDIPKV